MLHVQRIRGTLFVPKADCFRLTIYFSLLILTRAAAVENSFNINCGSDQEYIANDSTRWIPDTFFYGGSSLTFNGSSGVSPPYNSLRYFDQEDTGCYLFFLPAAPYLIRLSFLYRNYDGLMTPPLFGLYVGGVLMRIINIGKLNGVESNIPFVVEVITVPKEGEISLCFLVSDGVPFVNAIQVNPLHDSSLSSLNQSSLLTHYRLNAGDHRVFSLVNQGIEWIPDTSLFRGLKYPRSSTNETILPLKGPPEYVPTELFSTVRVGEPQVPIVYSFRILSKSRVNDRFVRLYFVEINPNVRIGDRRFNVQINSKSFPEFDILKRTGGRHFRPTVLAFYVNFSFLPSTTPLVLKLILSKSDGSLFEPVLSGVEIFEVFPVYSTTAHVYKGFVVDVNRRLEDIRKSKSKLAQSSRLASLIIGCLGTFLILSTLLALVMCWKRQHMERLALLQATANASDNFLDFDEDQYSDWENAELDAAYDVPEELNG